MASTHLLTKPVATIEKDGDDLVHESLDRVAKLAFEYTPLPSSRAFRVLVLLPGPPNSRLECRLNIHDIDTLGKGVQYTAISYAWNVSKYDRLLIGPQRIPSSHAIHDRLDIRHPVFCGDKRLLVSTSLYNLLRRTRHSTEGIELWIDAICINQNDLNERARQVLLMHDIYSRANGVVLWLGEEDDETEIAFALANKLAHHPDADPANGVTTGIAMNGLDLMSGSGPTRLGLPPADAPDYQALFRLFERPVFRRSWVIQEAAVAKMPPIVFCGDRHMLFAELLASTTFLRSCGWLELLQAGLRQGGLAEFNAHSYAADIMRIRHELTHNNQRPHIELTIRFEATDPRDKIYAMLGLLQIEDMPAELQALLRPDYNRSIDDIYRDATIAFICAEDSLAVLSLAGDNPGSRPSLPSWVPDYARSNEHYTALVGSYPMKCPYHASGDTTPGAVAVPGNPRELRLRAFRAASVTAVAEQDPSLCDNAQLLEWIGLMRRLPQTYAATSEEVENALWRTLVGNRSAARAAGPDFPDEPRIRDSFHEFMRVSLLRVVEDQGVRPTNHMLAGYEKFYMTWLMNMAGRRFFLTDNQLMGMGGPGSKAGDEVYVVAGAMVPFVVRRQGASRRLVGDCYVHGIMKGECLGWNGFAWQDLVLE